MKRWLSRCGIAPWRQLIVTAIVVLAVTRPTTVGAELWLQASEQPQITLVENATVYLWPNKDLGALGQLPAGSVTPVNGRTPAGDWWRIPYPGGPDGHGWVLSSAAQPNNAALQVTVVVISFVTATPPPSPTACQLNASYVADVTIPDGTVIGGGQPFEKTWRMRNSGTCPWPGGVALVFKGGTRMAYVSSAPVAALAPGEVADVHVNMSAPQPGGMYWSVWQMRTPAGQWFGDRITVVINVPTPIPPPMPPPAPQQPTSISFWADRTEVRGDECTIIHWSVTGVQVVYLEYGGKSYGVDGISSRQVCPAEDGKTYRLRIIMPDGSTQERELRIELSEAKELKIRLWADKDRVQLGECTHVRWETENSIEVQFFDGDDWKRVNRSDFRQVCPEHRTRYKIKVYDTAGSEHEREVTVSVDKPA